MANGIAKIILQQLGGTKFIVMTGAKNLRSHGDKDALSFKLPSNFAKLGINHVKISLNGMDTYDIQFGKIWGTNFKVLATEEGIYCDQLQEIFTSVTGLDTHL